MALSVFGESWDNKDYRDRSRKHSSFYFLQFWYLVAKLVCIRSKDLATSRRTIQSWFIHGLSLVYSSKFQNVVLSVTLTKVWQRWQERDCTILLREPWIFSYFVKYYGALLFIVVISASSFLGCLFDHLLALSGTFVAFNPFIMVKMLTGVVLLELHAYI